MKNNKHEHFMNRFVPKQESCPPSAPKRAKKKKKKKKKVYIPINMSKQDKEAI